MYKVLLFGAYPENNNLIKGGVEAAVSGLAAQLNRTIDVDVKVVCYPKKSLAADRVSNSDDFEKVFLANPYRVELLSFLRLRKIIKEIKSYKPDVVHIHGTHLLDLILILYLKVKQYHFIITVHGILTVEHAMDYKRKRSVKTLTKYWIYALFEYLSIKMAGKIIVDTFYVKDWLLQKRLATCENIFTIPQGIDNKYYHIPHQPDPNTIISIGSITPRKGYTYAIRAFKMCIGKHPGLKYYIIGFCQDKEYYNDLCRLIEELELNNHVQLLIDIDTTTIQNYLSKACVFILHSQEESQGIAFCEAMAVGKPIVATKVGGIPYIIKNNVNGLLSQFADTSNFSDYINQLLEDEKLRTNMSNHNKKEATKFSWEIITTSILLAYSKLNV